MSNLFLIRRVWFFHQNICGQLIFGELRNIYNTGCLLHCHWVFKTRKYFHFRHWAYIYKGTDVLHLFWNVELLVDDTKIATDCSCFFLPLPPSPRICCTFILRNFFFFKTGAILKENLTWRGPCCFSWTQNTESQKQVSVVESWEVCLK